MLTVSINVEIVRPSELINLVSNEMLLRMLTVHCDQNNSYEITINGFQVRKINEIRNVIFGLRYGKPSSSLRPKLECSPS